MTADVEPRSTPTDERTLPPPDPAAAAGEATDEKDDKGEKEAKHLPTAHDVASVVLAAIGAMVDAGKVSAGVVSDGAESAARALAHRTVDRAVAEPRPVGDERLLATALAARKSTDLAGGTFALALVIRSLKRLGPLSKLTKRSPLWLAVSAVPAFTASVTRGSDELALVSSLLTLRARGAGVTADPERVRRVTVQLLSREPIDPEHDPSHGALVVSWLRRGVRAALPYTKGAATRDPKGLAARTAAVDPNLLGQPAS